MLRSRTERQHHVFYDNDKENEQRPVPALFRTSRRADHPAKILKRKSSAANLAWQSQRRHPPYVDTELRSVWASEVYRWAIATAVPTLLCISIGSPHALPIRESAIKYAAAQEVTKDKFEHLQLRQSYHSSFIEGMFEDLRRLGQSVDYRAGQYGPKGYAFTDFVFSIIPALAKFTPTGRLKQDLITFAIRKSEEVEKLVHQVSQLIEAIKSTENARKPLFAVFMEEYDVQSHKCLRQSNWLGLRKAAKSVGGNDAGCLIWFYLEEHHQCLGEDTPSASITGRVYRETLLETYQALLEHYGEVATGLRARTDYVEIHRAVDVVSFRKVCRLTHTRILRGSATFERFVKPRSQWRLNKREAQNIN